MSLKQSGSFLRDTAILFLGVMAAAWLIDAIEVQSNVTLVVVALILSIFNRILKPILVFFALPLVIFTFGLAILLINALLLYLVGGLVSGFEVPGFGTALLGSLIVSLVSMAVNLLLPPRPQIRIHGSLRNQTRRRARPSRRDDVIDV